MWSQNTLNFFSLSLSSVLISSINFIILGLVYVYLLIISYVHLKKRGIQVSNGTRLQDLDKIDVFFHLSVYFASALFLLVSCDFLLETLGVFYRNMESRLWHNVLDEIHFYILIQITIRYSLKFSMPILNENIF